MDQQEQHTRIAVIEVLGRDGLVRQVQRISRWPARIGRSPQCEVVLDDAHLAPEHALLQWAEAGAASLLLMPSLNGGWMGEQRLNAGDSAALAGTANFQLGASQLRWRSNAGALAPEQPMLQHQQRAAKVAGAWVPVLLLVWLGLLWLDRWSELNPGSPWVDYSGAVLGPLVIVLGWAALWSLVTQLFQHRFPFLTHLRRALIVAVSLHLISSLLPLLAFALSWRGLMVLDAVMIPCGLAALLWWHACLVWPRARRWLALAAVSGLATLLLLTVARRQEQQYLLGPAFLSTLPPPALRLVEPKATSALIDALRPLEAELARQANKDNDSPSGEGAREE